MAVGLDLKWPGFWILDPIQNPDHLQADPFLIIQNPDTSRYQGWYTEFLLVIVYQYFFGKTGARLNLTIMVKSLHIGPDPHRDYIVSIIHRVL